jgi:hypothetical protein
LTGLESADAQGSSSSAGPPAGAVVALGAMVLLGAGGFVVNRTRRERAGSAGQDTPTGTSGA